MQNPAVAELSERNSLTRELPYTFYVNKTLYACVESVPVSNLGYVVY
jgi:hypothetical protein